MYCLLHINNANITKAKITVNFPCKETRQNLILKDWDLIFRTMVCNKLTIMYDTPTISSTFIFKK